MQESDWKTLRRLVPELRERYLRERNRELVALLTAAGKTETERFWEVEKQMRREEKILRDCLDGHSRSRLFEVLMFMRRYRMLPDEDLAQFSQEMQEQLRGID